MNDSKATRQGLRLGVAAMSSLISVLRQMYRAYFYLLARTIGFMFPARLWYRIAYRICSLQGRLLSFVLVFSPLCNHRWRRTVLTRQMQSVLPRLAATRRPFPIPICHKNAEAILEARKNTKGVVFCSVHLPFITLGLRCLMELGVFPDAAVSNQWGTVDGRLPIWGMAESVLALVADRDRHILVKARTILRQGGVVATLIDSDPINPINRNIFRLIRSLGARLVFITTELQPDGRIMVEFFAPPDPFCLSDESVEFNLLALQDRIAQIQQLPSEERPIATLPVQKEVLLTRAVDLGPDSTS